MNEMEKKILDIIKEEIELPLSIDEISMEDSLVKYGVNSISFMRLVTIIEDKFNFEFDDDFLDNKRFKDVRSFINYIIKKIS